MSYLATFPISFGEYFRVTVTKCLYSTYDQLFDFEQKFEVHSTEIKKNSGHHHVRSSHVFLGVEILFQTTVMNDCSPKYNSKVAYSLFFRQILKYA